MSSSEHTTMSAIPRAMAVAPAPSPGRLWRLLLLLALCLTPAPAIAAPGPPVSCQETAYHFRGSQFISFGRANWYKLVNQTIEFWIKPSINNPKYNGIIGPVYDTGSTEAGVGFQSSGTEGIDLYVAPQFSSIYRAHAPTPTGVWTHVAGVVIGGVLARTYVNGTLHEEKKLTHGLPPVFDPPSDFWIARFNDNDEDTRFIGALDEIRMWNYPRSSEQILANFNKSMSRDIDPLAQDGLLFALVGNRPGCAVIEDVSVNKRQSINTFTYQRTAYDLWPDAPGCSAVHEYYAENVNKVNVSSCNDIPNLGKGYYTDGVIPSNEPLYCDIQPTGSWTLLSSFVSGPSWTTKQLDQCEIDGAFNRRLWTRGFPGGFVAPDVVPDPGSVTMGSTDWRNKLRSGLVHQLLVELHQNDAVTRLALTFEHSGIVFTRSPDPSDVDLTFWAVIVAAVLEDGLGLVDAGLDPSLIKRILLPIEQPEARNADGTLCDVAICCRLGNTDPADTINCPIDDWEYCCRETATSQSWRMFGSAALADENGTPLLWAPLADPARELGLFHFVPNPNVAGVPGVPCRVLIYVREVSTLNVVAREPKHTTLTAASQVLSYDYLLIQESKSISDTLSAVLDGQPVVFKVAAGGTNTEEIFRVLLPPGIGLRLQVDLRWCTSGTFRSSAPRSRNAVTSVQLQGVTPGSVLPRPVFTSAPESGLFDNDRCMRMSAVSDMFTSSSLEFASITVALLPGPPLSGQRRDRRAVGDLAKQFELQSFSYIRAQYVNADGSPLTEPVDPLLSKFVDEVPPNFLECPETIVAQLSPNAIQAAVAWDAPLVEENGVRQRSFVPVVSDTFGVRGVVDVDIVDPSLCDSGECVGGSFSLAGSPYTVTHTATDTVGNEGRCTFQVRVLPPPVFYRTLTKQPLTKTDGLRSTQPTTSFGDTVFDVYFVGGPERNASDQLPSLDQFQADTTHLEVSASAQDSYAFDLGNNFLGRLEFDLQWDVQADSVPGLPQNGSITGASAAAATAADDSTNCNALEFNEPSDRFLMDSPFAVTKNDLSVEVMFKLVSPLPPVDPNTPDALPLVTARTADSLSLLQVLVGADRFITRLVRRDSSGTQLIGVRGEHSVDNLELDRWYFLSVSVAAFNIPTESQVSVYLDGQQLLQERIGEQATIVGPTSIQFDLLTVAFSSELTTPTSFRVSEVRLWQTVRPGAYDCPSSSSADLLLHYIFEGCGDAVRDLSTRPRPGSVYAKWLRDTLPATQVDCAATQSTSGDRLEAAIRFEGPAPNQTLPLALLSSETSITRNRLRFSGFTGELPSDTTWTTVVVALQDIQRSFFRIFQGKTLAPSPNSYVRAVFIQGELSAESQPVLRIKDNQAPTITSCPPDVTTRTGAGLPTALVPVIDGTATDNDAQPEDLAWTYEPAGVNFGIGRTPVTTSVTDPEGNVANCQFVVQVQDVEPPTLVCPEQINVIAQESTGMSAPVSFEVGKDILASDNSQNVSVVVNPPSGSVFPSGLTTVRVRATDPTLRSASCSFQVLVSGSTSDDNTGLVVGVIVAVILALLLLFLLFCYHRKHTRDMPHDFSKEVQFVLTQGLLKRKKKEDLVIPREIPRHSLQILQQIGKGAFGRVSMGTLTEKDKMIPAYAVAIKEVSSESREEALREAAIMAQFDHENVISLVGVVTKGDPIYLVLTHCKEGSLLSFLRRRTGFDSLTLSSRLNLAYDVSSGLAYLHGLGFVHRDLAARNVLVGTDYRAMISDFGMARQVASESGEYQPLHASGQLFPIRWTAPEAIKKNLFSAASDVWSFGVLLYEIWTNCEHEPYAGWSGAEVVSKVEAGYRLPKPPDCPQPIFESVVAKCWATETSSRPSAERIRDYFKHCVVDAKRAEHWRPRLQTKREASVQNKSEETVRLPDGTTLVTASYENGHESIPRRRRSQHNTSSVSMMSGAVVTQGEYLASSVESARQTTTSDDRFQTQTTDLDDDSLGGYSDDGLGPEAVSGTYINPDHLSSGESFGGNGNGNGNGYGLEDHGHHGHIREPLMAESGQVVDSSVYINLHEQPSSSGSGSAVESAV